jgi:hypothetical protein
VLYELHELLFKVWQPPKFPGPVMLCLCASTCKMTFGPGGALGIHEGDGASIFRSLNQYIAAARGTRHYLFFYVAARDCLASPPDLVSFKHARGRWPRSIGGS